ncbi:MAG: DUF938 domain-containing protein [Alphaproteobacteria bacterium]|nr:DUF938 domain-containing protein [Alphaproteobacteria bacterium]
MRNREPILDVLRQVLPPHGCLLEIASGTGEHAAYMAPRLACISWQPSDADPAALGEIDAVARASGCARILPALELDAADAHWPIARADAMFCCNMIHIAPWSAAQGLFAGAARLLPASSPLVLYGPFKRNGIHTAPSNAQFEAWLKALDTRYGVRCLDSEVLPLAAANGFVLADIITMPANNLSVIWRRS